MLVSVTTTIHHTSSHREDVAVNDGAPPVSKRAIGMAGDTVPYLCLEGYDNEDFLIHLMRTKTLPALTVNDKNSKLSISTNLPENSIDARTRDGAYTADLAFLRLHSRSTGHALQASRLHS